MFILKHYFPVALIYALASKKKRMKVWAWIFQEIAYILLRSPIYQTWSWEKGKKLPWNEVKWFCIKFRNKHLIENVPFSYSLGWKHTHTLVAEILTTFVKASYFLDRFDSLGAQMCCIKNNFLLSLGHVLCLFLYVMGGLNSSHDGSILS